MRIHFLSAELLVTKQEESAVRQGPSLLEALCHFYRAIRFLNKGVRLSNLFPEAFSRGGAPIQTSSFQRRRGTGLPRATGIWAFPQVSLCMAIVRLHQRCAHSQLIGRGRKKKEEKKPHHRN